jgi:methyl-accepting chemotaxis protein PixJ
MSASRRTEPTLDMSAIFPSEPTLEEFTAFLSETPVETSSEGADSSIDFPDPPEQFNTDNGSKW